MIMVVRNDLLGLVSMNLEKHGALFYQVVTSTPISHLFLSTGLKILYGVDEPAVSVSFIGKLIEAKAEMPTDAEL